MEGDNKVLPMAISINKTELSMSFEFPTDPEESLFFLMQRPKSELFSAFIARFERNVTKRWRKEVLDYRLFLWDGKVLKQNDIEEMVISDILSPGNRLVISGRTYLVQKGSPKVVKFGFPKRLFVDHYILPKLSVENAVPEDCQFLWYRRPYDFKKKTSTATWLPVDCDSLALKLTTDDAGHQFKLVIVPRRVHVTGVRAIHYTTSPPEVHDACDVANYLTRAKATPEVLSAPNQFRVVSYNLLAEMYTDTKESKDMFAYCPKEYLEFSYRKSVLYNELLAYNADLYLLQEVDSSFYNTLSHTLKDFRSAYLSKKDIREGCAIFYRSSKFRLSSLLKYTLSDLLKDAVNDDLRAALETNPEVYAQLEKLPNTFMIMVLEEVAGSRKWIVGNTHLYAGETADTIRFLQSYLCFTHLQRFAATSGPDCCLIFGGDFNSTPDTCVLEILANPVELSRFPEYPGEDFNFRLDLSLKSACGLPDYTNYTRNFVGCLDYIFYDPGTLRVKDSVPMPSHEDIIEHEAIPSRKFPSDHIPLICTLEYCI